MTFKAQSHSPSRQLSILDPMRSLRGCTKPTLTIGLVFRIVAIKPNRLAVTFEREDMGRDPIQKPAIVRDHHRATSEALQRLFKRAQGVHVQVARRLVEQQN